MFYLHLSLFNFISPSQFFYSLLHNFIIFSPQCFYSLLYNFYYFPSSMLFIPLPHLHLLIYSIYFSIHKYIDFLSTLHRPHIDPTLNFFLTQLRESWNYTPPPPPHFYCFPPPPPPPPHLYCFPSTTTFLLFSLHHHISTVFPPPPPPPPHFYCFSPWVWPFRPDFSLFGLLRENNRNMAVVVVVLDRKQ